MLFFGKAFWSQKEKLCVSVHYDRVLTAGNLGITGPIAHHELPTNDRALLVADGLAVVVHLETGDGLGRPHVGIVAVALGRPAALLRRGIGPLEHVGAALGGRLLRVLPSGFGHGCCRC